MAHAKDYAIKVIIQGKDEASPSLLSVGKNLKSIGKIATGAAAAAVGAVGAMGAGIAKLAIDAAPLQGIESAFGALAERIGTSSEEMLAKMEEASAGMIAQRDIMKSVNLAAALVGDQFAEEMPRAMAALTKAAAATGEDMDYMMDSLVRGVGRVSPLILDNLGVQMDMNKALEDYATKHGIAAATTTVDNSKAIADMNEKMGFAQREMANLEAAYHDANAEFIHAQQIWPQGSVELNKFQTRVEKAQLAMDKKTASIAKMNEKLGTLQAEHGKTEEGTIDLTKVLTKEQQQMALLDQVVGKLEDKYADMPPVTENVATSIAAMQAKFQNLKDRLGKAFLPVFGKVMSKLAEAANRIFPLVTNFIETQLVPILNRLAEAFEFVFDRVMTGKFDFTDFMDVLEDFLPVELVDRLWDFGLAVLSLVDTVRPYVEMAVEWIAQHVELKDALVALGIAVGTFLIPLVVSLASPILALVATFAVLTAAITLLRKAWETDWMGIRTALADFWENTAQPALSQLWEWLQINVPVAIQTLSDFWTNTLLPALQAVWAFIQDYIIPIWQAEYEWLATNIPLAIQTLSDFWTNTLLPALQMIWAFVQEYVIPLFLALSEVMEAVLGLATTVLAGLWENVLWPALEKVWALIQDNVIPILEALTVKTEERVGPKLTWLREKVLDPLRKTLEKVKDIIKKVIDFLDDLADAIRSVQLPDWATPGSPTPFELGMIGIANAIEQRTLPAIHALSGAIGGMANAGLGGEFAFGAVGAGFGAASGATRSTTNYFNLTVHSRAETSPVVESFETMRALVG